VVTFATGKCQDLFAHAFPRAYCHAPTRAHRGFTLVELMIGLVLVAILMSIGVPMFRSFVLDQRLRATSSDLRIALTTARSEAVKRNTVVEVKPREGVWKKGWTIPSPIGGDPDLLNHVQSGDVNISGPDEAQFNPVGRAVAEAAFEIDVEPGSGGTFACLRLSLDGSITSTKGTCPDG